MEAGVDVVSDGEMSKISYATYIEDRFTGFAGDTPREPGQDLVEFPRFMAKLADSGATAKYRRPRCVGEIRVEEPGAGADGRREHEGRDAASPDGGVPERGLAGRDRAVPAERLLPDAGRLPRGAPRPCAPEYEAIVAAGLLLQIDAPDLAMGRHTMYRDRSVEEFLKRRARTSRC